MIKLVEEGQYSLLETKGQTKILSLERDQFAWVNAIDIGEILVTSHRKHKVDSFLSMGNYRLYEVKDEPKLTDVQHLELFVGDARWQGYLLPTGLPSKKKRRSRIIPTPQTITRAQLSGQLGA